MNIQRNSSGAWTRLLFVATVVAATGCASTGRAIEETGAPGREVEVRVENQNFYDAVVYAIWGSGPRDRLGTVTGNSTETFTTEARGTSDMRIEVDFVGAGDVQTRSMGVFEGDRIDVVIPPNI